MTGTQALRGFATVSFFAADHAAAKKWYTELLGMVMYNPHYLEILGSTQKA